MMHGLRLIISFLLFSNTLGALVFALPLNAQEIFVIDPRSSVGGSALTPPKSRIIANPIFLPSQLPQKNESLYLNTKAAIKTSPDRLNPYPSGKTLQTFRIQPEAGQVKKHLTENARREPSNGYVKIDGTTTLVPVNMKELALSYDVMHANSGGKISPPPALNPLSGKKLDEAPPAKTMIAKKETSKPLQLVKKVPAKKVAVKKLAPEKRKKHKKTALASIKSFFTPEKETLAKNAPAKIPTKKRRLSLGTKTATARDIPAPYKKSKIRNAKTSLFFAENSDIVNIEGFNKLGKFSSEYKNKINNSSGLYIHLTAYADGVEGTENTARKLSLDRALNTKKVLSSYGIRKDRIKIKALGNNAYDDSLPDRVDISLVQ
ncbi:MAG: hypothetical protein ACTSXQ_05670 [Alphaproteobacteria bacterium]